LSGLRNSTPKVAAIPTSTTTVATGPAELAEIVLRGGDESLPALARLIDLATRGGDGFILAAPLVEGVLAARAAARAASQYPLADQLRDVLIHAGVEVNDTPTGATWSLTDTATK
jgi:cysteinyl-tRNA synthetase